MKTKRDSLIDGYVKDVNDGNITVEEALDSLLCYIEDKKDKQIDKIIKDLQDWIDEHRKFMGEKADDYSLGISQILKTIESKLEALKELKKTESDEE